MEVIPPAQAGEVVEGAGGKRRGGGRSTFKAMLARVPGVTTLYGLGLYLMDDEGSDLHRLLILAMGFYFISPIDLIPDFLAIFGFADDLAILLFLVKFIGSEKLAPYREEARRRLRGEAEELRE